MILFIVAALADTVMIPDINAVVFVLHQDVNDAGDSIRPVHSGSIARQCVNPRDGAQFLTQLAQFQQMEQSMNMGQDIAAIRGDLDQATAPPTGATTGTN